jgi:hypothetical protein
MKWYIGQKVVYVGNDNPELRNKVFIVMEIRKSCCHIQLYFGIATKNGRLLCKTCGRIHITEKLFKNERVMRPLEDNFADRALEKAIEQANEIFEIMQPVDNGGLKL